MHTPKIWSQGVARRALSRGPTHNPSPAAAALLGSHRVARAGKFLRSRGIKRRHKGNPLPAVVATVAGGAFGKLFKTSSEKRAAGPAASLVNAAVQGNLTAAKAIAERTEIGIQKERAVWRKAALQVPAKIMQLVQKYSEQIPGVDHSTPESAADSALARAVNGLELEAQSAEASRSASAAKGAIQARREELFAGVAGTGLQALASRGRSLRRPTRRRRKTTRARSIRLY